MIIIDKKTKKQNNPEWRTKKHDFREIPMPNLRGKGFVANRTVRIYNRWEKVNK